ncbi:putative late blight resistance protein -like protein R1A-10-like [Capsicum annuum]|nr:putative late blight resistance protein -like protein R1A-10-like [Capsicum annuum]KAF3675947.1 putative late blight resistance protein -like protein R1A-10-like [Capsicum annuum]
MTKFMHVERNGVVLTLSTQKYNGHRFSFQINGYSDDRRFKLLPSVARSIYLFSKTHNFLSLEVFSSFHLLRVLAIFDENGRYHSIPPVITKLFHLRYLQVRSHADLPASISELQNLQTLIYERCYNHTTLPEKIWTMKNLRHMHIRHVCYLPSPRRKSILNKHLVTGMPNLVELSNLYFTNCTNEILSSIPNLKRLIVHYNDFRKKSSVNRPIDMSSLTKLEALKCVSNAFLSWTPPISIKKSFFPASLKRLTFSGWFGFPWEDISTLVKLPNLEELKLKDRAAIGDVWRLRDDDIFESLKLLLFRRVLLVNWLVSCENFPSLKRLVLKKCDNLKEIPIDFGEIFSLESIELHNCSTSAEDSARKIEQEQEDMGNNCLKDPESIHHPEAIWSNLLVWQGTSRVFKSWKQPLAEIQGDSLGGAYVNIGDGMGSAYVKIDRSVLGLMVWNTRHGQGPDLGRDKLGIKARFMVPGYLRNRVGNTVMPLCRIIDQNAQADEVRPTYGMRTHNRAHTPELVPTPGVPPVPTSPPRAPQTNVNRPPTAQRDISNTEFRRSIHMLTQLVANQD